MKRRTINIREARAEAEAAEARGLLQPKPAAAPRSSSSSTSTDEKKPKPRNQPRLRVVWAVCDSGGRTVATFPYAEKDQAEARIAQLAARNKGPHFLRSVKEPMNDD